MISLTIYSQEYETIINSIDTLKIEKFNHKKVVIYELENAKICISAKNYLTGISGIRKNFKKLVLESKTNELSYEFTNRNFKIIDSIYKFVQNGIKTKDTIIINYKVFKKNELNSLINFEYFIDKGNCVIYDEKGIRQYKIIRKKESYYIGPENAWGGRRYYLLNQKKFFFECTDLIS